MRGSLLVSVSSIHRNRRSRSRVLIVAAIVAFAALAALGMRFIPDAAAAEAVRLEEGDFVFERSTDNILGVTNKKTGIRLEDNLDTVTEGATEQDFNALLTEVRSQFAADFGWDLTADADRTAFRNELHLLSQALFSISDDTFEVEEFAPLRDLRDLVAGVEGTAECRDRCLPVDPAVVNRVVSTAIALSVRKLLADVTGAGPTGQFAIYAVSIFVGGLTAIVLEEAPAITGLSQNDVRMLALASAVDILRLAKQLRADAGTVAKQGAETVVAATRAAAKEVETATPTEPGNESASDYDLVKDEL